MDDRDVLAGKLDAIRGYVARLRSSGGLDRQRFLDDQVLQDAALFNLVQATQAAVDAGAYLIAAHGWETPTSLGHTFAILATEQIIADELAGQLASLVGLRNLVVYRYGVLDLGRVHLDLADDLDALGRFVTQLGNTLAGSDPEG